ncbi:hypothetical protein RRG08_002456 [Elysia crispata]|uniref:Uncharacterized protein n=1 Tax=Elysia crispata TaxID=231223 RepID=A0AAE1DU70_9GAST|nr:hypothetical protein RRG08_002456 [Elysia crispata]
MKCRAAPYGESFACDETNRTSLNQIEHQNLQDTRGLLSALNPVCFSSLFKPRTARQVREDRNTNVAGGVHSFGCVYFGTVNKEIILRLHAIGTFLEDVMHVDAKEVRGHTWRLNPRDPDLKSYSVTV